MRCCRHARRVHDARAAQGRFRFAPECACGESAKRRRHCRQHDAAARTSIGQIGRTRIPFIENKGQGDPNVKFSAPTFGGTVFVTRNGELVYSLPERIASAPSSNSGTAQPTRAVVLKEELVDGNVADVRGETGALTRVSVFRGNDPAKWRTGLATYETLTLGEVYPGVTARLSAHTSTVEKLFYVAPMASPKQIRLRMKGGQRLATTDTGELEVTTELGAVRFSQPIAYQQIDGERR